jgi:hypothetical protein
MVPCITVNFVVDSDMFYLHICHKMSVSLLEGVRQTLAVDRGVLESLN